MLMGGLRFGGGRSRDVSIRTEARPTSSSASRPSAMQKFRRISNASDEFGEACIQLSLLNLVY